MKFSAPLFLAVASSSVDAFNVGVGGPSLSLRTRQLKNAVALAPASSSIIKSSQLYATDVIASGDGEESGGDPSADVDVAEVEEESPMEEVDDNDDAPSDVDVTIEEGQGGETGETASSSTMSMSISMSDVEKAQQLQKLLILASSTDRGQFASTKEHEEMDRIIYSMETSTSEEKTTSVDKSAMMEGTWELLYSSTQLFRSSPFFMAGRAVCQTEEEAQRYDWFCDMHRAALAISEIGKVRQIISSDRMVSEFEVNVGSVPFLSDLIPFTYSGGMPFTINGAIVSSADITPTADEKAWEIYMDTVEIKGSNIPLLRQLLDNEQVPVSLQSRKLASVLEENVSGYNTPKPIFETTYLDDTIRISRDQDGKVFLYGKSSDVTEPTEYKSVDSDLGILKLLEGLNDNFFKLSM
uniref:Plastid lipid-associated protein/fibrillin conserved domain-containing protein n=1 Tax=Chaetoceros debilis TaxID=122233 RepID=A0A7S3Q057_9STRA